MSQHRGARQFASGDTFLSSTATATIGTKLHLSSETDDLTLTLSETEALADFLRDQSTYPEIVERLARIHGYVLTGEMSKQSLYPVLLEYLLPFLPTELLSHVQDILAVLSQNRTENQA
jgi:hypothetical protein